MKRIIFLLLALLTFKELHAQCTPNPLWYRYLPNASYRWYWDGDLGSARFKRAYGDPPLSDELARTIFVSAIEFAIAQWRGAANNRVNIVEGTALSHDIFIHLEERGVGEYGHTDLPSLVISINSYPDERYWTDVPSLTEPEYRFPDIYTVLVHEMGHIFLGLGHTDGRYYPSVMDYSSLRVKRGLYTCDQEIVLNFYNPLHTITATNSFGGGYVKVDSDPNEHPVPFTRQWREVTFPHILRAEDQPWQENGQTYMRRFTVWTHPLGYSNSNRNAEIPISDGTYTANFRKQFNINVTEAAYIEPGSGATYKVNGTDVGSSWSGTFVQDDPAMTLEAVPPTSDWAVQWSDGSGQNPRTIVPTDHMSLYATYKLHLASSSAEAISQSGQRKIIRDSYGTYHLTYISASRVWYSRSTNGGTTWLPEIRLSQYEPPEHCSMFNAGLIQQG